MRLLPKLDAPDDKLALPLAEPTAERLALALLTADFEARASAIHQAVTDDPLFAAWALSRAATRGPSDVNSFATLSSWLARNVFEHLIAPLSASIEAEPATAPDVDSTALSALVTRLTARLDIDRERAILFEAPRAARDCLASNANAGQRLLALATQLARLHALEAQFADVVQTEKLAALKELAYGAGHEINNPLANISARAQTLLRDERDPERRRMLAAINTQAFRAHEMIADLMLFARPPRPKPAEIDLRNIVAVLANELQAGFSPNGVSLLVERCETPVMVRADATQLAVAIKALVVNARQAVGERGQVVVAVDRVDHSVEPRERTTREPAQARVRVSDNGPGISPEVRRHLFDPFYSGREAGRGLGFGLSKCWRIVQINDGRLAVESTPGQGARFTITLPLIERPA